VNIFIYQTLDNVDGKQARRTQESSALGELFDHGCDSLFLLCTCFPMYCLMSPTPIQCFWVLTIGQLIFYFSHWVEFYTGTLVLGRVGNPTEVQIILIGLLLSGIYPGASWWQSTASKAIPAVATYLPKYIQDMTMTQGFICFLFITGGLTILGNIVEIFQHSRKHKYSFLGTFGILASFFLEILIMTIWVYFLSPDVVATQLVLLLSVHGMIASMLCDQLLIARICRMPVVTWNTVLVVPLLGALNAYYLSQGNNLLSVEAATRVLFGTLFVIYWDFIVSVVNQLSAHLGIRVFHVRGNKHLLGKR